MEDILAAFESDEEAFSSVNENIEDTDDTNTQNNNDTTKKKDEKFELYTNKNFGPLDIDINEFERKGKSFTIYIPILSEVPTTYMSLLSNIVSKFTSNDYTFRVNFDNNSPLNKLLESSNKTEFYIPWKAFNNKISFFNRPDYKSYRISLGLRKNFFTLSDAVRSIIASQTQTILGRQCKDPVNFIIVYSDTGNDLTTDYEQVKAETEKNLLSVMQIARKAGIMYFNIKNDSSVDKLKDILKNIT